MNVSLLVDAQADLGEGPIWDHTLKQLYWVDIEAGQVHIHRPGVELDRVLPVGCKVGTVVPRASGHLMLATAQGFEAFDTDTCQRTTLADPERHLPDNRFNDGKCDAKGRFWAGTMSMTRQQHAGSLYVLDTDHCVRKVLDGVTTSNGLDWSPDLSTMYYIDTPTMKVQAFDYEAQTGAITHQRTAVTIPEGVGRPDGMTVDAEGMLWVAHWDGSRVTRWDPASGELLQTILLPADRVTSCTFGGEQLDTLFITTARHGLTPEQLARQPHAGGLFAAKPGVCGRPANRYGG